MGRRLFALLAGLAIAAGAVVVSPALPAARAASFDAGNIISDSQFFNSSAMTSAQIQTFLDRKVGTCRSSDCINILRTSVSSRAAKVSDSTGNVVCKAFPGGTNLRVSEIIYRAQVACGISAKVILVTLQKEQGLVTSTDPSAWNLSYAMGQACPDTAPCDPAYKGIGVQILAGATQLKTYKAAQFGRQVGTYKIQYSPTSSCGTKTVSVKNYATAALYNYTPYTPNAAALKNLDGAGDKCSSYGNRNFWRDYTRWFGSTQSGSVSTIDTVSHLLTLDASGELWAYPASGKSTWLPRVSLGAPWSDIKRLVAPGDLDGDGHRDLITVSSSGAVALHRGDGILGYLDPIDLGVDWAGMKQVAAAGDLSGDGIPDVLTLDASGDAQLWRGTETGRLRDPVTIARSWQMMDTLLGAGDLDGDGRDDLLVRRSDGVLMYYPGTGQSTLRAGVRIGSGWGSLTALAIPGDFSGDGRKDLIARTNTGALRLYPGLGNGRFGNGRQIGTGWSAFTQLIGAGPAAAGARTFTAGAGDVDDDGHRDILSRTAQGQLRVTRGNGSGGILSTSVVTPTIPGQSRLFPLGDFDGDGIRDLGMIDSSGALSLLSGLGASGFSAPVQLGTGWGALRTVFGAIDFDGDGALDILATDAAGALRLYRGDGHGGVRSAPQQIGSGWGGFTAILTPGDFTGDGNPDLLARRSDGALVLYPTDGAGHWKTATQVGSGWGGFTALFSAGNFDGAGGPDLVARRADGTLVLYSSSGRGTWSRTSIIGAGWGGIPWIG